MIDKVDGHRIGSDINPYLIAFWQKLQRGWFPQILSREEYQVLQLNRNGERELDQALTGYAAFACSFRGKFFGGFAGKVQTAIGTERNYQDEARKNTRNQIPFMQNVILECQSYQDLAVPDDCIIYCDPPYADTTGYMDDFDSVTFWKWVRCASREHEVYVSEYKAPDDFECLWEQPVRNNLSSVKSGDKSFVAMERLFRLKN